MDMVQQSERILVVAELCPDIARLLRVSKRYAVQKKMEWEVVVPEPPKLHYKRSTPDKEALINLKHLAKQMGAIVTVLEAEDTLKGLRKLIRTREAQGITIVRIKVADTGQKQHWRGRHSLAELIQKHFGAEIKISVVPLGVQSASYWSLARYFHVSGREILMSLVAVALATATVELMNVFMPELISSHNRNKTVIYMVACAFAAGRYGLLAGIVASVASFLSLSSLYATPYHTLTIEDPTEAVNLALFLLAGIILSFLGSRDYGSRLILTKQAQRFNSLLKIHRLVLNKNTTEEAVATLNEKLKSLLGAEVAFFFPALMQSSRLEALFHPDLNLNEPEQMALQLCWDESKTTGIGTQYQFPHCQWRFEPLVTMQDEIGVLGVRIGHKITPDADFGQLLSGIADQVALILERLEFEQLAEKNKIQAEREKLRSMLLSSVSHDLKTPLASVIGSLSVYRSMGAKLPEEQRLTLINTALEEAQRLDSFITNILDMTRIESGQIELKEEWVNPGELVDEVRKRLRERLRHHDVMILPAHEGIQVAMDAMMTGQVIQNLLDNTAKYTDPGTRIEISWHADRHGFHLAIRDHGKGIPEQQLEKVFDKYARIKKRDSQVAGTGLGLAIARAVVHAQGGSIHASNHPEGGAVFTIILPKVRMLKKRKAV
jgi:two-component system, OmpR family, sensor histidine kinase KdpD